jgi:hypothetical protein
MKGAGPRGVRDRIFAGDGPFAVTVKVAPGLSEGGFDGDVIGHVRRFTQALAAPQEARWPSSRSPWTLSGSPPA